MKLSDIKTTHAFSIVISIAVLGFILLSLFGSLGLKRIMSDQDALYMNRYIPTTNIYEVHTSIDTIMLEMTKIEDTGYSDKAFGIIAENKKLISENIAAYEKSVMTADETALITRLKEALGRYYIIEENIAEQKKAGKKISQEDINKLGAADAQLLADIDAIVKLNLDVSAQLDKDTDSSATMTLTMFILLSFILTAVLVIPSVYILKKYSTGVHEVNRYCSEVADGNLKAVIRDSTLLSKNELGTISSAIHRMVVSVGDTVRKIRDISNEVASSSEEMAAAATTFSDGAQGQSASTEEVTATIEQVSAGMEGIAHNALAQYDHLKDFISLMNAMTVNLEDMDAKLKNAQLTSSDIAQRAQVGGESLGKMTDSMERITGSSTEMTAIVGIINDISDKINLLSLNAAIEAARAGDAGRGFAVVADEISKLADGTATSIKDIDRLIKSNNEEIQTGQSNIALTIESITTVISGVNEIGAMMNQLSSIMLKNVDEHHVVNDTATSMQSRSNEIKIATDEQKSAMSEIVRSVASINELTQSNAAGAEEISGTSESLASMSENLRTTVEYFKV